MDTIGDVIETLEKHIARGEYELALAGLTAIPNPSPEELEGLAASLQRLALLARSFRAHLADELSQVVARRGYAGAAENVSWQIEC